ncbi:MAG: BrnT family toxin [Gammaproteobacteria bacterium]|nr:BrnT family toxin [Gammaproteobacteria bacterium]
MDAKLVLQGVTFVWDKKKASINLKKHGVSFNQACEAFFDPFLKVVDASRHFEGRNAIVGYSRKSQLLFVVYRENKEDIFRIISARKTTNPERSDYENL